MNKEIIWFNESRLKYFISFLKNNHKLPLAKHLPELPEDWYQKMLDCLERVQLPYYKDNYERLASLFYNIIKNHHLIDGNKRSAVIILGGQVFISDNELHITSEGTSVAFKIQLK